MEKKYLILAITLIIVAGAAIYYFMSGYLTELFLPSQEKIYTIGVLRNPPSLEPAWSGFADAMVKLGYEEGKNVRYLVDEVGRDLPSTKAKVENFIEQDVDLIYVMGVLAGRAVKEVTKERQLDIPVVFGVISNPVAVGLVESMQRPGGNITGVTPHNEVVVSKRLELFDEMLPGLKRITFGWSDPATTGIDNLRASALALGVELMELRVQNRDEMQKFLEEFPYQSGDAIFRATDAVSGSLLSEIIALSLEKKVPLSSINVRDAELGALMSYGADYYKIGQQAARLVDAILKGANPGDIPVELPENFEFVINLKTADALGLTIPTESLSKATRIIR